MNERIRELAVQAGAVKVWEWASDDVLDTKNMDAKKFAKLIVKECIQAVDNVGGYNEEFHMNAIKEHFGVEE
jgi:hypothetical protein